MDFASVSFTDVIGLIELAVIAAGVLVACWGINEQRKRAKESNSLNVVQEWQRDGLERSMHLVAKMCTDGDQVESYASLAKLRENTGKSGWDRESRRKSRALIAVVDQFEKVSIGIRENIYDREIIRAFADDMFVEMFRRVEPFIREMRKAHYSAYGENFQIVAEEFAGKNPAARRRAPFFRARGGSRL